MYQGADTADLAMGGSASGEDGGVLDKISIRLGANGT